MNKKTSKVSQTFEVLIFYLNLFVRYTTAL